MKHAFLTTATAAMMALGGYASAADLKISHVRPQGATIDVELRAFSAAVEDATGGDVKINLFPAPIPFSEAFTAVQTGVVDGVMALALRATMPRSAM